MALTSQQDRDAWVELNMERFAQLCNDAYQDGDFTHVKTLLQANHEGMGAFLNDRTNQNNRVVTNEESFHLLKAVQKMNMLMMAMINRNAYMEGGAHRIFTRVESFEDDDDRITKLIQAIKTRGG